MYFLNGTESWLVTRLACYQLMHRSVLLLSLSILLVSQFSGALRVFTVGVQTWMHLLSLSQTCLTEFKSELQVGHSNRAILTSSKNLRIHHAMCRCAISCTSKESTQTNGMPYFGGAYGDARMPNWPHRHRTPLPKIVSLGLCQNKGEHFEADNLSAPIPPLLLMCADGAITLSLYWILGLGVNGF